ncbi:hypothetical protein JXA02_12995 [candidate division KSB1 bacterium]|nr:hypothetical protein [candidate division KSB1 bacterium]RQW01527.1 MAG: hypothetical protein EH222_15045 [candidate division KSB1 bacterium]
MAASTNIDKDRTSFQPVQIMGIFWLILGIVVLFGSFFINETPHVPQVRSIVTNIIAGSVLFIIGLLSILRGGRKKKKLESVE